VRALTDALASKEVEVRGAAAHALGEIGPGAGSAVEALTGLLKDEDADVRKTAALALGKIQGQG
jgi:HEAT repeat protein